ncbi:MAG: hypothetical protein AB7P69_04600 [Candidatus Binatia bacterium]
MARILSALTLMSILLSSCGPLGTPMRPLGPVPEAEPTEKNSPQEQLERFNILLDRA